jgi:hypothetical protein
MELGGLRQLAFTSEGVRNRWDFIVGDSLDNKSEEYKESAYNVLTHLFEFVEMLRATEDMSNQNATGFVNAAFLIFLKSGCTEPEIIYEFFKDIAAVEHLSDDELDNYPDYIDSFATAYCSMEENLTRHPSYRGKIVFVN